MEIQETQNAKMLRSLKELWKKASKKFANVVVSVSHKNPAPLINLSEFTDFQLFRNKFGDSTDSVLLKLLEAYGMHFKFEDINGLIWRGATAMKDMLDLKADNEIRYFGETDNYGRPHGKGIMMFADKIYEVQWHKSNFQGKGRMIEKSLETIYDGEWIDWKFNGKGKFIDKFVVYQGNFKNNLRDGYGKLHFSQDHWYEGNLKKEIIMALELAQRRNQYTMVILNLANMKDMELLNEKMEKNIQDCLQEENIKEEDWYVIQTELFIEENSRMDLREGFGMLVYPKIGKSIECNWHVNNPTGNCLVFDDSDQYIDKMIWKNKIWISCLDQITEHIFLGDSQAASDEKLLKAKNIKYIVRILYDEIVKNFQGICYYEILAKDKENENILNNLESVVQFINSAIELKENVLVHCWKGVSRSATILAAYLMLMNKWRCHDTLTYIKAKRPVIKPNNGFLKQLLKYKILITYSNLIFIKYTMSYMLCVIFSKDPILFRSNSISLAIFFNSSLSFAADAFKLLRLKALFVCLGKTTHSPKKKSLSLCSLVESLFLMKGLRIEHPS